MDIDYEDKERAQKFYSTLFGWTFGDYKDDYFFFISPSGIDGGFVKRKGEPKPSMIPYINVDKLDQSFIKKLEEVNGKTIGEAVVFPNHGGYIEIMDSEGNKFAIWSKDVKLK